MAISDDIRETVSLVIYHRGGARVVPLGKGKDCVLGRGRQADVSISDRSLSRQHARFRLLDNEVSVEDLGSTNGTRVAGRKISKRTSIKPGDEVFVGDVGVSIHRLTSLDPLFQGLEDHDRFTEHLAEEVQRAKASSRKIAVVMVRAIGRKRAHLSQWCPHVQQLLRSGDRMAVYGLKAVLISLPEFDEEQAVTFAHAVLDDVSQLKLQLVCGVAVWPDHAASADELIETARLAAQQADARHQVVVSEEQPQEQADAQVVVSSAMHDVYKMAKRVASSLLPVLILGETGTGKEVIARYLHAQSDRQSKPLLFTNCASIPAQLLESTLFGHEQGAFTGANQLRKGLFEEADGGTIVLDEVGELAPPAQAALLRVLESGQISRVGSAKEIHVDTRVVAATNRDLEAMCSSGEFRWDLYYRLNTITLKIPLLADRPEEILPLAKHFLKQAARANRCKVREIDSVAARLLQEYRWPGNVRELRNVIDRAVVIAEGKTINAEDLSERVQKQAVQLLAHSPEPLGVAPDPAENQNLKSRVDQFEANLILAALRDNGGNQTKAASALGLPIRTLVYKIRKYGLSQGERAKPADTGLKTKLD